MRIRDLFRSLFRRPSREAVRPARRGGAPVRPQLEALEGRLLLSFSPLDIRHAYGFDRVGFLDSTHAYVPGDGRGTTIAIVDAYDDPTIATDLANFDALYGLPAPPSFTRVNQRGGTALPKVDLTPTLTWARETALDVEYAHAAAPGASILLVEADSSSFANLDTAVRYAAGRPGVVAVSMSFGRNEYDAGTGQDASLVHAGVTFVASTGDNGAPGHSYSPNVVAVGGTSLTVDAGGNYSSEAGWSGGGGGVSPFINQPGYQNGVVTQSSTQRCTPDVSFVADPDTGVIINDTWGGAGFYTIGGTSAAAPIMAGLVAVVNQGRSYLNGQPSYHGGDFLSALYKLPGNAFHDVTTGNNGFAADTGYDLVTGRGTPNVPRFVAGLTGDPVLDPTTGTLLAVGGGRNSTDTFTVNTSGSQLQVTFNLSAPVPGNGRGGAYTKTYAGGYTAVEIDTVDGSGKSVVNLNRTFAAPVTVKAGGLTAITLGTGGSAQQVRGPVALDADGGAFSFTVDNSADGGSHTVTLDGPATGDFGRINGLTPFPVSYRYNATINVTLKTGTGVNTVTVLSARTAGTLNLEGHSASTTVNLGAGGVQGIVTAVSVTNPASTTTLNVNDSLDALDHTVTVGNSAFDAGTGAITSLAPQPIYFKYAGVSSVTVRTGPAIITVNVLDVVRPLTLISNSSLTAVNVGKNHSLAGIQSNLTVHNPSFATDLQLDDSADAANRTVTVTSTGVTGLLSAGAIGFSSSDLHSLTVLGGGGKNTYNVSSTPGNPASAGTTVNTGGGVDTVNVRATTTLLVITTTTGPGGGGNDVVNIGNAGSVRGILGAVSVFNGPSYDRLNLDDSADAGKRTVTLQAGTDTGVITGLAQAPISYGTTSVSALTVTGGGGGNVYTVLGLVAYLGTTLNTGTGVDTVNVAFVDSGPLSIHGAGGGGNDVVNVGSGGSAQGVLSPVTVTNTASTTRLNINNAADLGNRTVTVSAGAVTALARATISYSNVSALVLNGGGVACTYTVTGTADGTATTLNTGGDDAVNVQATTGALTVNCVGGFLRTVNVGGPDATLDPIQGEVTISGRDGSLDQVFVNDSAGPAATYTLTATGLARPGAAAISFTTTASTLHLDTGGDTVNVQGTPGVTYLTAPGDYTVNAGTADGTLAGLGTVIALGRALIHLEDRGTPTPQVYAFARIDYSSFTTAGTTVGYDESAQGVVLDGGPGGNTVYVQETLAGTPVTINPGTGANTIAFGVLGDTLESVRGFITVNGSGADTFLFDDQGNNSARVFALTAGAISWSAEGGIGATVGYSGASGLTVNGGGGGNTFFALGSLAGTPVGIDGGSGDNTLVGSDAGNFWDVQAGLNFALLYGPAYASQVYFQNVQNLTAGAGGDTFYFEDGASVSGNITGSGPDTLSYAAYTMSVVVDLQTGKATAVGGTVSGIDAVEGGNAPPSATGVYNLLIGNGHCLLAGGAGRRNILVAGGSAGTLIAGGREDLLIAGSTAFDTEADMATWLQLADYWAGSDDFLSRVFNLTEGVGVPRLDAGTVTGNGGGNTLIGNGELAWLFTDGQDFITGFDPASPQVAIDP